MTSILFQSLLRSVGPKHLEHLRPIILRPASRLGHLILGRQSAYIHVPCRVHGIPHIRLFQHVAASEESVLDLLINHALSQVAFPYLSSDEGRLIAPEKLVKPLRH